MFRENARLKALNMYYQSARQMLFSVVFLTTGIGSACSQDSSVGEFLMCSPGKLVLSDDFESDSVAEKWGFRASYNVEKGSLNRTNYVASESARAFLKDALYRDAIIRFDFRFDGASEIRLMTGGGGGYNTVTQIFPDHFQVHTAKRKNEFDPSQQGDCAFEFKRGVWHTMTVEFNGDEVVAHVNGDHFVLGRHPIIDSERTYLAFQVTGGMAAFDNFKMWTSQENDDWNLRRAKLQADQKQRGSAISRNAKEEFDLIYINLKDRLKRTDEKYRDLIARRAELEEKLKADYPSAHQSHKEIGMSIANRKKEKRKEDPKFKEMEQAFNRSSRAVKDYVHSVNPKLDELPKQSYYWEYERCRVKVAADQEFLRLEKEASRLEDKLHAAFPDAFQSIDVLVDRRKSAQAKLKTNDAYKAQKKAIAEFKRSIDVYLFEQEPRLAELADSRAAIIKSSK